MKKLLVLILLTITTLTSNLGLTSAIENSRDSHHKLQHLNNAQYKNDPEINVDINYNYLDTFYTSTNEHSAYHNILDWSQYTSSWIQFFEKYKTFTLKATLIAGFIGWNNIEILNIDSTMSTKSISYNRGYRIKNEVGSFKTEALLQLFQNGNNIAYRWFAWFKGDVTNVLAVKIEKITFYQ